MSGSTETNTTQPDLPSDVEHVAPADTDPETLPPDALPPDDSNRVLVDEEGPF